MNARVHALIPVALIAAGAYYGILRHSPAATATPPPSSVPAAVQYRGTHDVTFKQPLDNQKYECARLIVPPGTWRLSYRVMVYSARPPADTGTVSAFAELIPVAGTNAPPPNDPDFLTGGRVGGNSYRAIFQLAAEKIVTVRGAMQYALVVFQSEGGNFDALQCLGERSTTIVRAERLS